MQRLKFLVVAVLCISLQLTATAGAESQTTTLSVAPAIIEIGGQQGEQVQRQLVLSNDGDVSLPVSVEIKSLFDNETSILSTSKYDASSWVTMQESSIVFGPNEKKMIPLVIQIPPDASPGGHYAQITIRGLSLETLSNESSQSIVIPELTVGFYVTVGGDITESFEVVSSTLSPWQRNRNQKVISTIDIKNTGNVHNLIAPVLVVYKNNVEIARYPLMAKTVLPESTKRFSHEWITPEEFGSYTLEIETNYGTNNTTLPVQSDMLYVTPPLTLLVILALAVWISLYSAHNHQHIKRAITILLKGA